MSFFLNKVVWITGASSGIGKELATQLVAQNAKVIISARREELLIQLTNQFPERVCRHLAFDLNDFSASQIVEQAYQFFGKVDILINNGGLSQKSMALETQENVDRQLFEVNYYGGVRLSKEVALRMKKEGSGQLVAISSILGKFGLPQLASYAASKHALHGWYESLRYELYDANISITIISPGFINTDVTRNSVTADGQKYNQNSIAQEKGMSAEKCGRKILYAVKKKKWHKNVGGIEIVLPLFKMLLPKIFFHTMKGLSKPK